ncbi:tetratricopeptide repeat protein [Lederbergia citrea]|uniref:tetratricopeptide repeat protein n=1 Tax=Lederbergia citrea TaxID=2833581 RepID=UPI001BC9600A|nr:tetratricopeptide repeat protein [Lederbergia citrea]MBS4202800.1 tetratricopeptide repeat protein [Lederbergia citrea]
MDKNLQGIEYLQQGNYEKAIQMFTEAIEENPTDAVAYVNFANVLISVGEPQRAEQFLKRAIEIDEKASAAYYSYGNLYFNQEKYDEAASMFEKALAIGPESNDLYYMLGMCFVNLGRNELSLPYLQRSMELDESDIEARFQYALALARSGAYDGAIEQLEKVTLGAPDHADAFYNLGVAYAAHEEDAGKALACFEKALAIQPGHSLAGNGKKLMESALAEEKE